MIAKKISKALQWLDRLCEEQREPVKKSKTYSQNSLKTITCQQDILKKSRVIG